MNEFAIVDLSAFYLDVLKDRMYTFAPTSQARRSAQTVLWQITEALVRLVAPILSFTADEVWEYLPAVEGRESACTWRCFPSRKRSSPEIRRLFSKSGSSFFAVRDQALARARRSAPGQEIGKGLDAKVLDRRIRRTLRLLERHAAGLTEITNVSSVEIVNARADYTGRV